MMLYEKCFNKNNTLKKIEKYPYYMFNYINSIKNRIV